MLKQLLCVVGLLLCVCVNHAFADGKIAISGKVTSFDDGEGVPGVNVLLKGTNIGTTTNVNGNYSISIPETKDAILVFSFIGMETQDVAVNGRTVVDVVMYAANTQLEEVVVTGLGVTREKQSLGYAIQEVKGEGVSTAKEDNFIRSLSGKAAGVNVRSSSTLGGGATILIRGNSSLSGNNQPLFVIDGVPIINSYGGGSGQLAGGGGYDLGNTASDINPEDIESISILKGASAAAIYGSRAANGVILITTKMGRKGKGIGVELSTGITIARIDKSTLPNYQNEYGGGKGGFTEFEYDPAIHPASYAAFDGDLMVQYGVDESWGPRFDPNLMVRHWDSWDPTDPENFGQKRPWVASPNSLDYLFGTGVALNNSIALNGGNEMSTFRVGYTNYNVNGTLPNSELTRNALNFNGSAKFHDKLRSNISINYVNNKAKGRPGTGYSDNDGASIMASFGMWHQRQLDLSRMENYRNADGLQRAWNRKGYDDYRPEYWDNPYWTRNENYQSDDRDRIYGKWELMYSPADWLQVTGRAGLDHYNYTNEFRINKGGVVEWVDRGAYPGYWVTRGAVTERNYDVFLTAEKYFDNEFSINAMVGGNHRRSLSSGTYLGTNEGLIEADIFAISNSVSDNLLSNEWINRQDVNSVYGSVSLGYKDVLFVELGGRNEWSSTLPKDNWSFFYPSASVSFVFSELNAFQGLEALSFGKLRANFARVGNAPGVFNTGDPRFSAGDKFNGLPTSYPDASYRDPNLTNETTEEIEVGLELNFFKGRATLDLALYKKNSFDQLLSIPVPGSSGFSTKFGNAGKIVNKGIEVMLSGSPIKTKHFDWNVTVNWTSYNGEVKELPPGVETIEFGSLYELKLVHQVGQQYGTFLGRDYVYLDGKRVVDADGTYRLSDPKPLGSFLPDWEAGITNTFTYKSISLSTLLDIRQGGKVFSQTHRWGLLTGVLEETVGTNDLGNPIRDAVADGGGVILDGVTENGEVNTVRISAQTAFNDGENPESASLFDASYIKLREVTLNYALPSSLVSKTPFSNISVALVGRNLAILRRHIDHIDPEASYGVGNIQGIDWGMLPRERTYGFKLNLAF